MPSGGRASTSPTRWPTGSRSRTSASRPTIVLRQAIEAEQAGFDGIRCSDHLAPWWTADTAPTNPGSAWVWLGAAAHATDHAELGSAVTAIVHRYNPVVVAWPSPAEQLERTEEAMIVITRLLQGERVDFDGRYFKAKNAVLYSLPKRRVPVYLSAFHEGVAELAGRLADGIWTLADPMQAPKIIAAYRESCEQARREPGEIILQGVFSVAESDDHALEQAREWKGKLVDALHGSGRRPDGDLPPGSARSRTRSSRSGSSRRATRPARQARQGA